LIVPATGYFFFFILVDSIQETGVHQLCAAGEQTAKP
jgi:hypothetical protein